MKQPELFMLAGGVFLIGGLSNIATSSTPSGGAFIAIGAAFIAIGASKRKKDEGAE